MRQLNNYSDERYRDICIYCDACLQEVKRTKDHVPSKALPEVWPETPILPKPSFFNFDYRCNSG